MRNPWVLVFLLFLMGLALLTGCASSEDQANGTAGRNIDFWTCSMHPTIHENGPGQCPICNMDLIPVYKDAGEDLGPRQFRTTASAKALMDIQVSPVERKYVTAEIRMVGKVDYDETRLRNISSRVAGRLDRLYVDYTGTPVRKGDHLVYMYSPEVLTAQEELIQALAALESLKGSDIKIIRETAQATVEAARGKLQLWGLLPEQIKEIEQRGKTSDHITIYAPISGIVIHKDAVEGMYVKTGTRIYTIADFSQVWVKLDAYESDLSWLRFGQEVELTSEADPGEVFQGRISFIDPVLSENTRTVKLRVNVPNPDGKLKPGMFVRAVVRSKVAQGGKVIAPDLAGKWISPMHPEIVKDAPGQCDVCGMDLVRAEDLGLVSDDTTESEMPLVIPVSAALRTGKRAVVYVQLPGTDKPTFEGREIVLGSRAGDYYIVHSGLAEGELVVTQGNFKIDSALQIQAKPSMMSPQGAPAGG